VESHLGRESLVGFFLAFVVCAGLFSSQVRGLESSVVATSAPELVLLLIMGILSTVFDLICSFFSTCQGYLVSVWEVFFFNTRVLYSSDTVMMATPLLFVLLVAWRIFGPDDQTNSIAMQGYEANEPHTLVNDRTYAGGGNYSGHTRTGAADQTTSTNKKDD
jgi:hypothetical protein